ncbi:hypothetical protein AGABI1DRAFT_130893 [Agaricus bisporus var. burnettii JB137-S8]|uniref:Uncharacterized protein n=2 Tax=Agaricus bisporus var. burnettii TaxID=192524 RepID=K5X166_AGABU|nr:uncharacterized protein AGABI1DRAFT_130893 [Agaricus bisporus var. burnettii JB137-S8]EKM76878.1 hypothetical protein AGABI1DRAFT_130893 [Agaricus bisporus var. burnettii JB137-S8]KAF7761000.1 hypothetical protein Agabi119p4_10409 [Agaricus bisporus var. burnettii]
MPIPSYAAAASLPRRLQRHGGDRDSQTLDDTQLDPYDRFIECLMRKKGEDKGAASPDNAFIDFARWATRSLCPDIDWSTVFTYGMQTNPEDLSLMTMNKREKREAEVAAKAWERLMEEVPAAKLYIPALKGQPHLLNELTRRMNRAVSGARSDDSQSLKVKGLSYVERQLPDGRLDPPIDVTSQKTATRGWIHPQIRELLLPANLLAPYEKDPEGTIAAIQAGKMKVEAGMFPVFMYATGSYRPNSILHGLLENPLPLLVYKHIFTGPSSAATEEFKATKTRSGQAKLHKLRYVTPETLAYAILHTHYMLWGVDDWRVRTGHFKRDKFFDKLVKMLSKETPWVHNLLAKLSAKVFGSPFDQGSEWDIDSEDDDFTQFDLETDLFSEAANANPADQEANADGNDKEADAGGNNEDADTNEGNEGVTNTGNEVGEGDAIWDDLNESVTQSMANRSPDREFTPAYSGIGSPMSPGDNPHSVLPPPTRTPVQPTRLRRGASTATCASTTTIRTRSQRNLMPPPAVITIKTKARARNGKENRGTGNKGKRSRGEEEDNELDGGLPVIARRKKNKVVS